jgi:hypothetical protein
MDGRGVKVEQRAYAVSTSESLGGMVLWVLEDRRSVMDSRKVVRCLAPWGIDGRPRKVNVAIVPKAGSAEDGGSDLWSVCNGVRSTIA